MVKHVGKVNIMVFDLEEERCPSVSTIRCVNSIKTESHFTLRVSLFNHNV
jgi:hypothetical protein